MRLLRRICLLLCLAAFCSVCMAEKFQNPTFVKTSGAYYQMLAPDLTHSGHPDLIYWSQAGNAAWYQVLRNDGQRHFTDLGAVSLPYVGVAQAVTGDLEVFG